MVKKWKEELAKHERSLLFTVYERVEFKDNEAGLQEDEYKDFLATLPVDYQQRFNQKGTFSQLAGSDGVLDLDKFKELLDQMSGLHTERK